MTSESSAGCSQRVERERAGRVMPVVLDTDIRTDIDDHWEVAMVLGSPELDVKLTVFIRRC
jgi:hypothetical protein